VRSTQADVSRAVRPQLLLAIRRLRGSRRDTWTALAKLVAGSHRAPISSTGADVRRLNGPR
jgi:hypothetical protein